MASDNHQVGTSRNLNRTRTQILLDQYRADLESGSPHPIRYLLFDRKFNKDIFYEITSPVDIDTLKNSLIKYTRERKEEPAWNDDVIKTYSRVRLPFPSEDGGNN
jgi:hypothetical protein